MTNRWCARARLALRRWAWSTAGDVRWLDVAQPFYEQERTVDAYDSLAFEQAETDEPYTNHGPVSGAVLDLIQRQGLSRVLDVGCGAGYFYHLLSKEAPDVEYEGIDASEQQVARACRNFGPRFRVADASTLTVEDFSRFDAIHLYSVLPFMAPEKQLRMLDAMLSSSASTILQVGATIDDPDHVPSGFFQRFGDIELDGGVLLTAVHFLGKAEIEELVARHPAYELAWTEAEYGPGPYLNTTGRDGGAVLTDSRWHAFRRRLGYRAGRQPSWLLDGLIKPTGWVVPDELTGPEVLRPGTTSA